MRAARIPKNGLWRVQHSSGTPPDPEPLDTASVQRSGNRFDAPAGEFEVRYYSSTRIGCFAETLARFRPDPRLAALVGAEWAKRQLMDPGAIPADWRAKRELIRVIPGEGNTFLDFDHSITLVSFRKHLAADLDGYFRGDLDLGVLKSADRRISRTVGRWVYENTGYAGLRYTSRLGNNYVNWAVFDRGQLDTVETLAIHKDHASLRKIATSYGLTIH